MVGVTARRAGLVALLCALIAVWIVWRPGAEPPLSAAAVGDAMDEAITATASGSAGDSALLPTRADTWLLSPRSRVDWDAEVLATYGVPWAARVPEVDMGIALRQARTIVVSNTALTSSSVQVLRAFAERGGRVIELGPLPGVCGPSAVGVEEGATGFTLSGDTGDGARWFGPIARLASCEERACRGERVRVSAKRKGSEITLPLATSTALGAGECVRWLGDMAAAIGSLRQGDPALADQRAPGQEHFKAADLFRGRLSGSDYDVPSADRIGFALAAQIVGAPGPDVIVDPLPSGARGLVLLTADQDFVPGPGVLAYSADAAGVGMTMTLTAANLGGKADVIYPEGDAGFVARATALRMAERGHSLGVHPNLVGVERARFERVIAEYATAFERDFGVAPRIVRNHHLIWAGYLDMAVYQARAGLRMNLDYVALDRGAGFRPGFMTGSGYPMRFVDRQGGLVPLLQQATQIDDLSLALAGEAGRADALRALGERSDELLRISKDEHVPITILHHPEWWYRTHGAWQARIVTQAKALGLPVWGAAEWLRFTTGRARTTLVRDGDGWTGYAPAAGTTLLLEGARAARVNGRQVEATGEVVLGGQRYGVLPPLAAGRFTLAPVLDARTP